MQQRRSGGSRGAVAWMRRRWWRRSEGGADARVRRRRRRSSTTAGFTHSLTENKKKVTLTTELGLARVRPKWPIKTAQPNPDPFHGPLLLSPVIPGGWDTIGHISPYTAVPFTSLLRSLVITHPRL